MPLWPRHGQHVVERFFINGLRGREPGTINAVVEALTDPLVPGDAGLGRTIAQLMNLDTSEIGKLAGRVLSEALPNGTVPEVSSRVVISDPAPNALSTVINVQIVGNTRYFDAAGFQGRTVGLSTTVLLNAKPLAHD
jgi:hypothetical protein